MSARTVPPGDRPADRRRLHALARDGYLDAAELDRALRGAGYRASVEVLRESLHRDALVVGALLVAAGAVFFVAANWAELSGQVRIGVTAACVVAATLAGGALGDRPSGRAAMLLGGLLVGPLLAVFGQVYQTGADAWQLFLAWSVALAAYGVLSRFMESVAFGLFTAHLAVALYLDQELGLDPFAQAGATVAAAVGALDLVAVAAVEFRLRGRNREMLTVVLAGLALLVTTPFPLMVILEGVRADLLFGLTVSVLGLAGLGVTYAVRRIDVGHLSLVCIALMVILGTAEAKLLHESIGLDLWSIPLLGIAICGQVLVLARWLVRLRGRAVAGVGGAS